MDFDQLTALLTPTSAGELDIAASSLGSPQLEALLSVCMTSARLSLTGATATGDPLNARVALGGVLAPSTFLGAESAQLVASSYVGIAGNGRVDAHLAIRITEPDWTPARAFSALSGTAVDELLYTEPTFALDTNGAGVPADFRAWLYLPPDDPAIAAAMVRGLSFSAGVSFGPGAPAALAAIFHPPIAIAGPVDLAPAAGANGEVQPQFVFVATSEPAKVELEGYELAFGFELVCPLVEFSDGNGHVRGIPQPAIALRGQLTPPGGATADIDVVAMLDSPETSGLRLMVEPANRTVPRDGLQGLLGGFDPTGLLDLTGVGMPSFAGAVPLQDLNVEIGLRPLELRSFAAAFGTAAGGSWDLLGILTLDDLVARISVAKDGGVEGAVHATAMLRDNPGIMLDGYVALPGLRFECELVDTKPLDLTSMIGGLVGGAVSLPTSMSGAVVRLTGDLDAKLYTLEALIEEQWPLVGGSSGLVLDGVNFSLTSSGGTVSGGVAAVLTISDVLVNVAATVPESSGGWTFSGTVYDLPVKKLIALLLGEFGIGDVPAVIQSLELDQADVSFTPSTGAFSFDCRGTFQADAATATLSALVSVVKNANGEGHTATYSGKLSVGDFEFDVTYSSDGASIVATATHGGSDRPIPLAHLVQALLPGLGDLLPGDLSLPLRGLSLLRMPGKPAPLWLVVCGLDLSLGLSDLPVIGGNVPVGGDVAITGIDVLWAARALEKPDIDAANVLLGSKLPDDPPPPRASLILDAAVGDHPTTSIVVPLGSHQNQQALERLALAATAPAAGTPSQTVWLDVQRSLGPVTLQRLGAYYRVGHVFVVFDASLMMSAFTLDLEGLGLGFTPQLPPKVTPALDGIGVTLDEGAVKISGGLRRVTSATQADEYDGALSVTAENLQLSALASYTKTEQGAASMFGFAVLDDPVGGPPAFYVTGVAAGFGVNRGLNVPDLSGLPSFPLIEAVTGDPTILGGDVSAAVTAMGSSIPMVYGQDWLALGLRFTTFELVQTSALLIARFGNELEFDILGLSVLSVPAGDSNPIAYAELAIEASVRPADGTLAIGGRLTPASYVLTPECHLTGGFAFCSWLRAVGDAPAGDFVLTVGGYHPAYHVPSWYPQVPRVGISWQVDSNMSVDGQLYYALTPNAVMAGGELDATWESDGLSAWFTAYADFLLSWRPFYYSADAGISIGASYTVDLWICSFTVTVHVGVDLEFHGPPFGGTASVDLYVATITIHFGQDSDAGPQPISWSDFKSGFLPADPAQAPSTVAARALLATDDAPLLAENPPIPTENYCFTRVSGGLLHTYSPASDGVDWILDPEKLQLTSVSVIPCTAASLIVDGATALDVTPSEPPIPDFGVGPVGVPDGALHSTHTITISSVGGERITSIPFDHTPVRRNVPSTAWLKAVALAGGDPATLNVQPTIVREALIGFVLAPSVPRADTTLAIDLAQLQAADDPARRPPSRDPRAIPTSDSFDQSHAQNTLITTIGDLSVGAARQAILTGLQAAGLAVARSIDADPLAALPGSLRSAPVLSYLGEEPAA